MSETEEILTFANSWQKIYIYSAVLLVTVSRGSEALYTSMLELLIITGKEYSGRGSIVALCHACGRETRPFGLLTFDNWSSENVSLG